MILVNNRDPVPWHDGITVKDVLKKMGYSYVLITVSVNGEHVPHEAYETHLVPDEADFRAFHLAHGG